MSKLTEVANAIAAGLKTFIAASDEAGVPAVAAEASTETTETTAPAPLTLDELYVQAQAAQEGREENRTAEETLVGTGDPIAVTLQADAVEVEKSSGLLNAMADGSTVMSDMVNSAYWQGERRRMGLVEDHPNALFMAVTLTHCNKPMNNGFGDTISTAEAQAALPSLILQPIDVSPGMDHHMRERLTGQNGIRGVVYASRLMGEAVQAGVAIWAADFPEIAEQIATYRDSLGASFDLLAKGADTIDGQRHLKGISFLGGSILARKRAADPTTTIGDLRYGGEAVAQKENEEEGMEKTETATAEAVAEKTVESLAESLRVSQDEAGSLKTEVERLTLEVANRDEKLTQAKAESDTAVARAVAAEGELAAIKDTAAKDAALATRVAELEALASENGVPLFESEDVRTAALAEVRDLDESAFTIYRLKTENRLLKAKASTPSTAAAEEGKGEGTVEATAEAAGSQPGALSTLIGTGSGSDESPATGLGERIAKARRAGRSAR